MTIECNEHTHKTQNSWNVELSGPASFGQLGLISDPQKSFNIPELQI